MNQQIKEVLFEIKNINCNSDSCVTLVENQYLKNYEKEIGYGVKLKDGYLVLVDSYLVFISHDVKFNHPDMSALDHSDLVYIAGISRQVDNLYLGNISDNTYYFNGNTENS